MTGSTASLFASSQLTLGPAKLTTSAGGTTKGLSSAHGDAHFRFQPPLHLQPRQSPQCSVHHRHTQARGSPRCSASASDQAYPVPKRSKEQQKQGLTETLELEQEEADAFLSLDRQSSLDAPPRHYEFMFLVSEKRVDEIPQLLEAIKEQVAEMRGTVWRLNDWGLRPLAYRIQKCWKANYFLMNVEIAADKANALNTFFQKDERVIRHLMSKKDAAEKSDYPAPILFNDRVDSDDEFDDDDDDEEEEEEGDEDDDLLDDDSDDEEDKEDEDVRSGTVTAQARG